MQKSTICKEIYCLLYQNDITTKKKKNKNIINVVSDLN